MIGQKRTVDNDSYDGDDECGMFQLKRFKKETDEHRVQLVPGVWLPGQDHLLQERDKEIEVQKEEVSIKK